MGAENLAFTGIRSPDLPARLSGVGRYNFPVHSVIKIILAEHDLASNLTVAILSHRYPMTLKDMFSKLQLLPRGLHAFVSSVYTRSGRICFMQTDHHSSAICRMVVITATIVPLNKKSAPYFLL